MAEALNRHDLEAFVGRFDLNYRSEQPAHPERGFGCKEQIRKNWSSMFESFPDFEARGLRHAADRKSPDTNIGGFWLSQVLQAKEKADERTRTADLISLTC
jgi:hypothetical protein